MNGIAQSSLWITGAIMLLLGIGVGLLLARRMLPGAQRARELEKELETRRAEHQAYRQQVTQHFEKTGDLFQEMAKGYRTVYDHLAHGAHDLCGEGMQTPRLDLPEKQLLSQPADEPEPEARIEPTTGTEPKDAPTSETAAAGSPQGTSSGSTPQSKTDSDVGKEAQPDRHPAHGTGSAPTDAPAPSAGEPEAPRSEKTETVSEAGSGKERPLVH